MEQKTYQYNSRFLKIMKNKQTIKEKIKEINETRKNDNNNQTHLQN